jgi:hypothetical protein
MTLRARFFLSKILIVGFCAHCFLPYLGLRFEGCHTMFSNFKVTPDLKKNNHLFFPQFHFSSLGYFSHLKNISIQWRKIPTPIDRELEKFLTTSVWVNNESVRWSFWNLCSAGHQIQAELVEYPGGGSISGDPCEIEKLSKPNKWVPIQLFPPNDQFELTINTEGFL